MKASLKSIAILLGCAVVAALSASCRKVPDTVEPGHPVSVVTEYSVSVNDEMLEALVVTVEYYDGDGRRRTETLTGPWTKTIESQLPAEVGARVFFALKDSFDASVSEIIHLAYGMEISGYIVNSDGTTREDVFHYTHADTKTIKTDRLAEWVGYYAEHGVFSALYQVTDSGAWFTSLPWK